jgi:alpha-L-rhamnosidase
MSLRFGLIPEEVRAAAVDHLVADIEAHGGYLTCGFLGVPHLLPALSDAGRHDVAYRLLLNEGYPSWLHSVQAGATTIWERWDGWTATRGFQDPAMNSFNHYAFGAVGEWLYRTVAGIDLASPGGRELLLAPCPDASLDWARGRWLSPRGPVACGWTWQSDGTVTVDVEVPVGATATLRRPASFAGPDLQLSSGQHSFTFTTSTQGSRHVRS